MSSLTPKDLSQDEAVTRSLTRIAAAKWLCQGVGVGKGSLRFASLGINTAASSLSIYVLPVFLHCRRKEDQTSIIRAVRRKLAKKARLAECAFQFTFVK